MLFSTLICSGVITTVIANPLDTQHFNDHSEPRLSERSAALLQVDLGYSIYEGSYNPENSVNEWRGVRFAAPPIGKLRWQPPQSPILNRTSVIKANVIPHQCPQSFVNTGGIPSGVDYINFISPGSEDCLFLNVYAPPNAKNLPVLVWIHGGGYGLGNAENQELGPIIKANNGSFIGVSIQYRLGAFGFLSSDEVNRFGAVNAGIRDQTFALEWVQDHIGLFGGDASRVTISGESAGAGSVMLQTMIYGGTLGTSLFTNVSTLVWY